MGKKMEVMGALILGYMNACINLKYIAGSNVDKLTTDIYPSEWYPLHIWTKLADIILKSYDDPAPIMEKAGEEMMLSWYYNGPGKKEINGGPDFLSFQTGSKGYISVVKGPQEIVGNFKLNEIDIENGQATVMSTTPFNRDMERGILIGGLKAPGDLIYVNVDNSKDKDVFEINFS